ncbi:MAG: VCBS repeat-containing protein [Spirochaetes bacterium]|nr:VCBS repeat-containing protein [Spirochaetota bacterium]
MNKYILQKYCFIFLLLSSLFLLPDYLSGYAAFDGPYPIAGGVGVSDGAIALGDFDHDNDLDLVVTGDRGGTVGHAATYSNQGNGTFIGPVSLGYDVYQSSVALGDVNGNSHIDIIVSGDSGYLHKYVNNGAGHFTGAYIFGEGVQEGSIALGRIDSDADLDLVVVGDHSWDKRFEWYTNNGAGNFYENRNIGTGFFSPSIVLQDLNNDTFPDIVVSGAEFWMGFGTKYLYRYMNDGSGNFTFAENIGTGVCHSSLALGDIDNNGTVDLIAAGDGRLDRYLNDGTGNFGPGQSIGTGVDYCSIALGDINNDNYLDLVVSGSGTLVQYINDGTGNFGAGQSIGPGLNFSSIALGDIDNDNDLDLIVTGEVSSTPSLSIYYNGSSVIVSNQVFQVDIKNIIDDNENDLITWTNITVKSQGWIVSEQYVEIDYLNDHQLVPGWGLQLFTDNKTNIASPEFIGSNDPAGLVNSVSPSSLLAMAWMIKEIKAKPEKPAESPPGQFATSDWHWLRDRRSTDFTNEKDYIVPWNQGGIAWHEAVRQRKPDKAYLYVAAKFENLIGATYRTSRLTFEEFHNPDAPFLPFYIYINKWDDAAPVPNHYTPSWEGWAGEFSGTCTADYGYTGDYHSADHCIRFFFSPDAKGAIVWYEPGTDYNCPSGPGYGYDLTGATKLTFWAKGDAIYTGVFAQIGINSDSCGTIENVDGWGIDTFAVTTTWVKHTIPLGGSMAYVSRGFKVGMWDPGVSAVIYIDDIRYEK